MIYRIAICLSGELRTWDYCKQYIKNFFEDTNKLPSGFSSLEVDYFIHTWTSERIFFDSNGMMAGPGIFQKETNDISEAIAFYKPKKHIIEPAVPPNGNGRLTWVGLAKSMCKSIELKRQYEIENKIEYNCVFKVRFDMVFLNHIHQNFKYESSYQKEAIHNDFWIVFMSESNLRQTQDVFLFGSSVAMDKLSNFHAWYVLRTGSVPPQARKPLMRIQHPNSPSGNLDDTLGYNRSGGPGNMINMFMVEHFLFNIPADICKLILIRPAATIFDVMAEENHIQDITNKSHIAHFTDTFAVIFDMDGVIVDSSKIHYSSLISATHQVTNIPIDSTLINSDSMKSSLEKLRILQRHYNFKDSDISQILQLKDTLFKQNIATINIDQHKIDLFEFLKSKNIKMAIASNSRTENINFIVDTFNIRHYFDAIVSGQDDVDKPKPHPAILFEVYKRLGIEHTQERFRTIFIEDTDEGAQAGYASPSTVMKVNHIDEVNIDLIKGWTT